MKTVKNFIAALAGGLIFVAIVAPLYGIRESVIDGGMGVVVGFAIVTALDFKFSK